MMTAFKIFELNYSFKAAFLTPGPQTLHILCVSLIKHLI